MQTILHKNDLGDGIDFSNIIAADDVEYPIIGFFCVSSVHGLGNTLDSDELEKIELYNREW